MKRKRMIKEADDDDDHIHTTRKIPYIPQEIIFGEILSRLPVKTLIRSKSVAKSWNGLISDPQFSKSHLKQSNRMRFMYLHDYSQCTLAYEAPHDESSETNKPIFDESSDVDFLASCNGLFCISNAEEDDMFFWNPSTRECKQIPGSKIQFPGLLPCTWASVFFGLGYHSPSDDYRLVRISMFDSVVFQTEAKIYSRNSNTWKKIKDFPYDFPVGRSGMFVSGKLHWIVSMWCSSVKIYAIAALNIEDDQEDYMLIKLPDHFGHHNYFNIGTLGQNLVLFCCNSKFGYEYNIWILKEYGKTETWTRNTIMTLCMENIEAFVYFEPLCLLGPDAILIRVGPKKFVIYNVKCKLCLEFPALENIKETRIVSFLESLVSPITHIIM